MCVFFHFFFTTSFLLILKRHETLWNLKCIINPFAKAQKNEIGININLLETNWNQSLIARSVSAFSIHYNAAYAVRFSLFFPESTFSSIGVESAGAFHRDESGKKNQKNLFYFKNFKYDFLLIMTFKCLILFQINNHHHALN